MIKLQEWDRLYRHNIDWALRMMNGEKEQSWINALKAFNEAQEDLFKNYAVTYKSRKKSNLIMGLDLNANELSTLFHLHMCRYTDYTVKYFIFKWWQDLRPYVDDAQPLLDCAWKHFKPAIQPEIDKARRDFAHVTEHFRGDTFVHDHTFKDDAEVLEYRGHRFIIDDQWGHAWTLDKNGEVRHFDLIWDWWYPIDEFLDLD